MKVKSPKIYSFKVQLDEYSQEQDKVVLKTKTGSRYIAFEESPQMKKKRMEVVALLKKNENVLREIENAMLDYHKERIIEYPQVSPVPVKSNKEMSDGEYYNGRVFWPEIDGKQKELRIYLGKKSEFKNFDDPKTIMFVQQMISMQLKKRKREKTLV